MYMPNTGGLGQTELMRQFYAQIDKEGFVIDERFNAGGQLADRFIEMLNRPVLYNISWRNADVTVWPVKGNNAPKVMLINGWAGSGGDAFPCRQMQVQHIGALMISVDQNRRFQIVLRIHWRK